MSNERKYDRRRFLNSAAMSFASFQLGIKGFANIQSNEIKTRETTTMKTGYNPSFGKVNQINAGVLNVGYVEDGPTDGFPVILLHGWPYDIHSYFDVTPILAAAGYRVIVPHLRGHGTTRFLSDKTFRNAQQSVVALDIIALMDALNIKKAIFGGFDWGARTANIIAALWPHRCKAMVSVNGYLISDLERNKLPLSPRAELASWYQYYFSTERGRAGLEANRQDFAKLIWKLNSPDWNFDDGTFDRTAASFDNPDYVNIAIHNYRWRLSLAQGDPEYDELEKRLAKAPGISTPTITLDGGSDGLVPEMDVFAQAKKFETWKHKVFRGIGHNLPQECPQLFAEAIIEADGSWD